MRAAAGSVEAMTVQQRALAPTGPHFSLTVGRMQHPATAWRWSPDGSTAASCIVLARGRTPRRAARRFLTTVLITDIVDSTGMAMRLGDRRWREPLADHYAACRAKVERNGGELVNTTGDGIVAIFDTPARAVRAAIALQAAASAVGIAVRAGLHTGECDGSATAWPASRCTSRPASARWAARVRS
jgi:class 3 adenylate cyclase